MSEQLGEIMQQMTGIIAEYGLSVVGAIVILIVGWTAAGWLAASLDRTLARTGKVDSTLRGFFKSLTRYAIIIFTILAVLNQFGVETTSFIAVLGAAGLAVGFALQGTLSNVAAGVMLLLFRPFKVGDFIEIGGVAGSVVQLSIFVTEMKTGDNVQIIVPNAQIWGSVIHNFSAHDTRRIDLVIGIGYGDDIGQAMTAINTVIAADRRTHADPAPMIAVGELGDNSVNLVVRVWCAASEYWPLKFDLTRAIKEKFDAEGISIPYPQRDLHIVSGQLTAK
jgi:small conductance mechanosensitive channel